MCVASLDPSLLGLAVLTAWALREPEKEGYALEQDSSPLCFSVLIVV